MSSAAPATRRANEELSAPGMVAKSSSPIRYGTVFARIASCAADTATRGSGPWWAQLNQILPSNGPKSSAYLASIWLGLLKPLLHEKLLLLVGRVPQRLKPH